MHESARTRCLGGRRSGSARPRATVAREEIFGPVLSILTYQTEDDAIALANDSVYGQTNDPGPHRMLLE
ncbi:hypothetical protein BamMEX5DRAFT_4856 [Burkholderia ambifaria MEX-5]|uniref:Aldehyde dehydrogenase domain-containing protein n=1 Tax=Burkholderia ambifaria MEX-5 TaxID=396597 RepID=B1TAP0_9BURK|nr:hypothetical protein BamMEX5DRAFT_4856 [Burkholderia ambifaria MEX-5]